GSFAPVPDWLEITIVFRSGFKLNGREMRRNLLIGLLLAALTLGSYWPVRNYDFIFYDDPQFVTENAQIQSGLTKDTVVYAFTHPVVGNWHPLTTLSHALDCELLGLNAGSHHLVNAVLHAANAALLFLLLRQLTRRTSDKIAQASSPASFGGVPQPKA